MARVKKVEKPVDWAVRWTEAYARHPQASWDSYEENAYDLGLCPTPGDNDSPESQAFAREVVQQAASEGFE